MKTFAAKYDHDFLYTLDKDAKLAKAFGARTTPHIYLFNGDGKLVYRGAIDDNARDAASVDESFLANAIEQLINDQPIEKRTSNAIGCSIKFQ